MTLKTGQNACEYFIAKNTCDAKTQTPNSLITSADFFITPSENSCNALCTGTLPTGAITGIITDKTSGAKIPDAQIEISDKKATTTTDGKYTISNVAATSQIIKISKDGYDVVTQLIVIQKDESITLDVPLKRSTAGSLRGLVKANNGSALRGVVVSYAGKEAITNPSGFYEISGLNKGIRGVLSAIKPGFSSFTDNDVEIPFETIFTYPDIVLNQVPECRQNERINSNSASQCKCGEVVMPNTDSGFCCFKEGTAKYSTASCQNLLRINGKVTALETGSFLTGVRVTIQPTSGGTQFFDFTEAGTYEVVLPSGNYQIIAEDLSGTPKFKRFNSSLLIDQNKTFDIKMLNALGACDSGNITNVNVFAVNVRGKPEINISWQDQCNAQAFQYLIFNSTDGTVANLPQQKTSFVIQELEYGRMYTFKFRGVYTNNRAFNKQIYEEKGNVICNGKTSTAQEFCVDKNFLDSGIKIYRSFCNENNKVRMLSGGNCTFERPGSVCSGPDKTGKTFCAIASSCYLPNMTNPFGLFFNKESCLFSNKADNLKNYCYFDYSNTIVDKCYSCTSIDSCYDYQSQKACEENSCQFANGNCAWIPSQYGVFGKGYCYQKNYTKTDKCSLCGPDSGLFKNTKCSQEVCSILGSCFSETKSKNKINLNFTQCSSCSPDTSCRQFKTKDLCIGIGNTLTKPSFNVPAGTSAEDTALLKALYVSCSSTPDIIKKYPLSKDSCSLGGCNWKPGAFGADSSLNTGDYCFKDVNFDGNPDCSDSTGTCNRDNIAPDTFVSFPAVINKNNRAITFTIIDKGSDSLGTETFVCFGNYCCPNNLVSVDSANPFGNIKKLTIADENGSLFQEARQGHNIMGFYSKDSRGNIESVQYKQIYIDTQPPVITITPDVRNSTISDLSDVDVRVSLDEFARCTARMEPVGTTFYTIKNPISNESGTELTASFTNVKDFTYAFIILCTDANGNTNKISQGLKNVVVDRNRKILSSSPQNKKLTNGNVLVKLNVTDRATCTLTNLDDNWLVTLQETGTPKIVGPFIYTFQFTNLANRTYRYNANCIDFNSKFLDSAAVFFTVDDQAPTTSVKLSKGGVLENFDQNNPFPYQVADLSLLCGDPNITGIPGQFNCNSTSTRWCFSTSITSCDPTNKFTRPLKLADLSSGSSAGSAGTGRICFFSSDLGGNIEQRKCVGIQRDIFPPEITNISMIGKRTQQ